VKGFKPEQTLLNCSQSHSGLEEAQEPASRVLFLGPSFELGDQAAKSDDGEGTALNNTGNDMLEPAAFSITILLHARTHTPSTTPTNRYKRKE
jgi:hypothetical protein